MFNLTLLFFILLGMWVILSGVPTGFHIAAGLVSCLLVVVLYNFFYKDRIKGILILTLRMLVYSLWMVKEIAKSGWDISLKMWQLEPEISPKILWIECDFKDDFAIAIYANSITLTPGSVAIGTAKGKIHVHCLSQKYIDDLTSGNLHKKCAKINYTVKETTKPA